MTSGALLVVQPALAAPGAGADPPVVASLAVTGPADCAGRADLVKLVTRRSSRIRFDDGARGPALRVAVEVTAPRTVAANLSIVWPDGARSERRLSAPTCAETADAIALVVVLALDPAAASREPPAPAARAPAAPSRTEPSRPRERPPATATAEPPAPPSPAPAPEPAVAEPPPLPPAAPPTVQAKIALPPAEPSAPPVYRWDVGGAFRVASGPAPSLMPGLALVAGWERDTASVLTLKVELIAGHYARDTATFDGTARVVLDLIGLRLCPLRVGSEGIRARLCASGSAGRAFAEGTDILVTRSRSRPFASVGGAASLAVSPRPRLEVTASVEPQVALVRDTYAFSSNVVYEVPALALFVGLGAAMTFQ